MFDSTHPVIEFDVFGRAVPKGSQKHVPHAKHGRPVYVPDPRLEEWEARVLTMATVAAQKAKGSGAKSWPTKCPVQVGIEFVFERPKKHHVANDPARPLKSGSPYYCHNLAQGDLDKLIRGVLDGMTGPIVADDSCVSVVFAQKRFGKRDAVRIKVSILEVI
jgi:Holliday junction resolvase RusA-like endonuclease